MPPVIVFLKLILLTSSKDNNLPFKAFILPFKAFFSTSMVLLSTESILTSFWSVLSVFSNSWNVFWYSCSIFWNSFAFLLLWESNSCIRSNSFLFCSSNVLAFNPCIVRFPFSVAPFKILHSKVYSWGFNNFFSINFCKSVWNLQNLLLLYL